MREISREALKKKLTLANPHWATRSIDEDILHYKRRGYFRLLFPLVFESNVNRALILMGPRRVGKTVLLHQTIQGLIDAGVNPKHILYLSIDTPLLQGLALEELLELYAEIFSKADFEDCFIIFDEIQYHSDWDRHLKVLVDTHRKTKFIASGSAAAALKRKSIESGAGRFTEFLLPPLTFHEYLELLDLTDKLLDRSVFPPIAKDIGKLNDEFLNYLNYGGYPEAVFSSEIQKNHERFIRSDIIDKVLLKDLPSLYGIQDIQELNKLFNTLAYQTGNEITLEGLSKSSGVAKNTIKRYIEYLEAAFLIQTVNRVNDAGKSFQRANYFKVYLTNPSMYSAIFSLLTPDSDEMGSIVETALFSQYMHESSVFRRIVYGRWKKHKENSAGEVDMVHLNDNFTIRWCREVKWSDQYFENPHKLESLIFFCKQNELREAAVTTRTLRGTKTVNGKLALHFLESAVACFLVGEQILENKVT